MLLKSLLRLSLLSAVVGLTSCAPLATALPTVTAVLRPTSLPVIPTTTPAPTATATLPATATATPFVPTLVPPPTEPMVESFPTASLPLTFSNAIAYVGPAAPGTMGSLSQLLIWSPTAGLAQPLSLGAGFHASCEPFQWSPDGRYVLAGRNGNPGQSLAVVDTHQPNGMAVLDNVSKAGAWAPNAAAVYFTYPLNWSTRPPTEDQGIWVWDVTTGEVQQALPPWPDYAVGRLGISPDGTRLSLHAASYEGRGQFALANLDGSNLRRFDFPVGNYAWSPDSQWVVLDEMVYLPEADMPLRRIDRNGDNLQVLLELPGQALEHPQFSPDGRTLAFISNREFTPEGAGAADLWVMDADGQNPRALPLPSPEAVQDFAWSPDGQTLVAYTNQTMLYLVPLTGTPTALGLGICPAWQP